jgi:hypothetical protein
LRLGEAGELLRPEILQIEQPADLPTCRFANVATDFGRDAGRPGRARSLQELAKRDGMGMAGSIDREAAAATP